MKKALIFDMDGLMIDSERMTYLCYVDVFRRYGFEMEPVFYKTLLGRNGKACAAELKNHYGMNFPAEQRIREVQEALQERFLQEGIPLKPGLTALLNFAKDREILTIVATSSDRNRADKILETAGLWQYFDDSVCGDEIANGKPNPDIFLKSCQKLGVSAESAFVLEDSEMGILAAWQAGIDCICIPDMKEPEPFYADKTYQILPSLKEVIAVITPYI